MASAELACDHAVLLEARGQGRREASRHARELHGEAVCGVRRLQPARARQPARIRRVATYLRARSSNHSPTPCATPSAVSPLRWPNRWRSSRPRRIPIGATGRACSSRSRPTGVSTTVASRCACRSRRREDTRVEHRPGGADGNPYLVMAAILAGMHHGIMKRCDPGPMVRRARSSRKRSRCRLRWEAALDAFDKPEPCCRSTSASAITRCTRPAAAKNANDSMRRSRIATTSGICARSERGVLVRSPGSELRAATRTARTAPR